MNNRPIKSAVHGILDYMFATVQLTLPTCLGLNNNVTKTYQAMSAGFAVVNASTDTPVGIEKIISFKDHQKADASFLAGLSLLTFSKCILKDKKALNFHLIFLTAAIANYVLTDYDDQNLLESMA